MRKLSKRTAKDQKCWSQLSGRFISKMCGAEDYGLLDEAAEFECLHDTVETAWLGSDSTAKTRLHLYFGAPENAVDLGKELANPAYRRHLDLSTPSIVPPALQGYIKARNARVATFRKWGPSGSHPQALERTIQRLVTSSRELSEHANRARNQAMAARRKEIRALNKAIERCCVEGLATTRSATILARSLLSERGFIPWQPGHLYLLRDLATQDLEATSEQRNELSRVIGLLHRYKSAP